MTRKRRKNEIKKKFKKPDQNSGSFTLPKTIPQKKGGISSLILIIVVAGIAVIVNYFINSKKSNEKPYNKDHFTEIPTYPKEINIERAIALREEAMSKVNKNMISQGLALLDQAIKEDPFCPSGYSNKGGVLRMVGKREDALKILIEGKEKISSYHGDDYHDLHLIDQGLFFIYKDVGNDDAAITHIKRAIQLEPTPQYYHAWAGLDGVSRKDKVQLYSKALELDSNAVYAFCDRFHMYAMMGEWDKIDHDEKLIHNYVMQALKLQRRTDYSCLQPYEMLYLNFSSEMLRDTAKNFAGKECIVGNNEALSFLVPSEVEPIKNKKGIIRKLRIGYVSFDFVNHPVGRNILGVFLVHDKEKFDIYCFSTNPNDSDPVAGMIKQHCNYVNISDNSKSHTEIARIIREQYKIDILIDLNGWTKGRRLNIFAARPAPVQVSHGLGFVGTTGCNAFDYFVSDVVASPEHFDNLYTENVVRLPYAYLPAAHQKVNFNTNFDPGTANKIELRKQNQLPLNDDIFVYCSFQSVHKISPESFDTWMRILQNAPSSVIWFTTINEEAREMMIKRANTKFKIKSDRLIFGEKKRFDLHLVRAQACDLCLDSWPYNAHSTATDLLWAGVPVLAYLPDYHDQAVTSKESRMWARVSASLLHTLGMQKLIKSSIKEFEEDAVKFSIDREAYQSLREELLQRRLSSPLFDIISYTRHHEAAYWEMYERFSEGKSHTPFEVHTISSSTSST